MLSHRRSTTVSVESYPFIEVKSDEVRILECRSSEQHTRHYARTPRGLEDVKPCKL